MNLYPYEKQHNMTMRQIAPECMVLLKNDKTLPLTGPGKVALYGSGARRTLMGGTGSGEVYVRHFTTVEEGLENAGFTVTTKAWLEAYEQVWAQARKTFVAQIKEQAKTTGIPAVMLAMGAVMPEPEYDLALEGEGETALYVLSRVSGEGSDRQAVAGDVLLTQTEIRDILFLSQQYKNFILILNVGGVVDLSPVMDVPNILLMSQLGTVSGDALTDVLLGKSFPSGRLAATWASWDTYCKIGEFGHPDDTRYREGIYVGYRYFDTAGEVPLFPFGFGLGYTDFVFEETSVVLEGQNISVQVSVKNTGRYPGKETAQLYVSVPSGRLDQPFQTLAAFAKTGELSPGEVQTLTLTFSMASLASYDADNGTNVLEAGDYVLRLGCHSRDTHVCGIVRLRNTIVLGSLCRVGGTPDFEDWKPEMRSLSLPWEEKELLAAPVFELSQEKPDQAFPGTSDKNSPAHPIKVQEDIYKLLESFSDSELAYLCCGNFRSGNENTGIIGDASHRVMGAAGETSDRFRHKGIPGLIMADGPAGLRLEKQYGVDENGPYSLGSFGDNPLSEFVDADVLAYLGIQQDGNKDRHGEIFDQYCTAIPIGTALAQSWNTEIVRLCGDVAGQEMERFGIHLWLAPALNIQRSVLCGRNYEYYSEDPLISGKMAVAMTIGVQAHPGCGVTIKHFACNNQETNRFRSNSCISERALRDIYLRGFEIAIKEGHPHALMTSYNLLNGEHTSQRRDLLMDLLRGEWGYEGLIMSDWVVTGDKPMGPSCTYPGACASGSIKAGNDVMMPGNARDHEDLMSALNNPGHKYPLTRADLLDCAAHVVRTARLLESYT